MRHIRYTELGLATKVFWIAVVVSQDKIIKKAMIVLGIWGDAIVDRYIFIELIKLEIII